jgi:peptidoglycan/xylan/chitin deacetylase (PgdA/CDA1 family)
VLSSRLAFACPEEIARTCRELDRRYGIDCMETSDRAALTSAMIMEMQASGLVEFGAHTVHHARLANLSDDAARWEIEQSKKECEALCEVPVSHFAYPYGDAKAAGVREISYCREIGFSSAVTTVSNTVFPDDGQRLLELPRLTYSGIFSDPRSLDLLFTGTLPFMKRRWDERRLAKLADPDR